MPRGSQPRLLLLTPRYPEPGDADRSGLTVYAELAATALRDAGAAVEVLGFHESDPSRQGVREVDGIRVHRLSLGWDPVFSRLMPNVRRGLRLLAAVRHIEGRDRFTAIEAPNLEGIGWMLARRLPNFWLRMHSPQWSGFAGQHEPVQYHDRFARFLDGVTARHAAHRITHSEVHAEAMRREHRLGNRPIHVVPHGIPDPGLRCGNGVPGRILAIGPLWPRKGADLLIDAFARLHAQHPEASLTMVGPLVDPVIAAKLEALRREHPSVAARIRTPGRLEASELEREWTEAGVAVVASRYESFGLVAVEAMARGIPLVTSDAGSLPEVGGDAAVRFPSGLADALAAALAGLLGDPARCDQLAAAGRERYLARYRLEAMGDLLLRTLTGAAPR